MEVKTFMLVFLCLLQCGACIDYPLDIFEELENKILNIESSMFQMKSSFNLKLKRLNRKTGTMITKLAKRELSNIIDDKVRSGEIQKTVDSSFNTQLKNLQHELQQMKNVFRLNIRSNDNRRAVKKSFSEYEELSKEVKTHGILIGNMSDQLDDVKLLTKEVNIHEIKIANVSEQLDDLKNLRKEVNTHGILIGNVNEQLDDVKSLTKEVNTHGIQIANVSEQLDDLKNLRKEVNTHGILISYVSDQLDDLNLLKKEVNTHGILISHVSDKLDELKINKMERLTPDTKRSGFFGLQKACEDGKPDLVKVILSTGQENINQRGKLGRTPVMTAARSGHYEVFTFLVSQGCNLTTVDHNQDNVLHLACMGGNGNIVRELLQYDHLGLESRGKYGRTPVMRAAYFGHTDLVELLGRRGSDLTVTDNNKDNILHVACIGGDVSMVKYILSKNIVGIESRGKYGRTPIMTAASKGHQDVFEFLVSRGGNPTVTDNDKDNILHTACLGGDVNMVKYILSKNIVGIESRGQYGRTPIMTAASKGHQDVFELLVSRGSKLTVTDNNKDNILHVACLGGDVSIVKYILSKKILGIESRGYHGRTPIMTAAGKGHQDVFELLVHKGSNLTVTDNNKNNILHLACLGGDVDIVRYLLTLGYDWKSVKNVYGNTPLGLAKWNGFTKVVELFSS